jgi:serine phosphatase RsbU (regulator of sigma subunit)
VLATALAEELPRIQVRDAAVSLFSDATCSELEPLVAIEQGRVVSDAPAKLAPEDLASDEFFASSRQRALVALPLRFQLESLGVVLLESGPDTSTYPYLSTLIGAAVKASELHHNVIDEVAARKQLEQEHLVQEARVAARIQTALAPHDVRLEGLEIAAEMREAAEVGGDYFDLLSTASGGWLAIGDVTGHGLAAGLMSLMLQSQIAALVTTQPDASPSWIVGSVNRVLRDNVRKRLGRDDHATLVLLRYDRSGRVVFAGAHDPIIVCRSATGLAECIDTRGVWVGALPDISQMTEDADFSLADGDLLVLHTDGITEAYNAHHEQFGLERLCTSIEGLCERPCNEVLAGVFRDVSAWTTSVDDDMSLVVARYSSAPSG